MLAFGDGAAFNVAEHRRLDRRPHCGEHRGHEFDEWLTEWKARGSGDRTAFAEQAQYRLTPTGRRENIAETGPHQAGHPGADSESHPFVPHVLHDRFADLRIEAASCEER